MIVVVNNGLCCFFFFKQKTAYEMRISDWSSDVCSSDLRSRRTCCNTFRRSDGSTSTSPAIIFGPTPMRHRRPSGRFARCTLSKARRNLSVYLGPFYVTPPWSNRSASCVPSLHGKQADRQSHGVGKKVQVRLDLGGLRYINKKN